MTTVQTSKAGFELNKTAISSSTSKMLCLFNPSFTDTRLIRTQFTFFPGERKPLQFLYGPVRVLTGLWLLYRTVQSAFQPSPQIFEEVADIQAANCTAFNKIPVLIIKIQTWLRMIGDRNDLGSSDAKLLNNMLAS